MNLGVFLSINFIVVSDKVLCKDIDVGQTLNDRVDETSVAMIFDTTDGREVHY